MGGARPDYARYLLFIFAASLILYSSAAAAKPTCNTIIYQGKGAGEVVFNGPVHVKKLTCDDCHESQGLLAPALFNMARFSSGISMKKMESGRSCGKCHVVSMNDLSGCSYCHRK